MANKVWYKPPTITTTEIRDKLVEKGGNDKEFFYIYVSTGGLDSSMDLVQQIEVDNQRDLQSTASTSCAASSQPLSKDKDRQDAMKAVHDEVLPLTLGRTGWKKVVDKDGRASYRALYFNIIPQDIDENDKDYIKRVAKIKETITEKVKREKQQYNNPNFKINCLLSKPFLYDGMALDEIS